MSSEEIQTMEVDSLDQDNKGKFSYDGGVGGRIQGPGGALRYWCTHAFTNNNNKNK